MEHVLSSEMDVSEALGRGVLEGYAVREVNLARLSFERASLQNVAFTRVSFASGRLGWVTANDVQFSESGLRGADLSMSYLQQGNFVNCEAIELNCSGALLEDVRWFKTMMSNACYRNGRLLNCKFQSSELYGACFEGAFLSHTRFSDASMGNASMSRADFRSAMLIDVDLQGANLHAANFNGAIMVRVDLRGANLVRADMRNVTMVGCSFNHGDLDGAQTE